MITKSGFLDINHYKKINEIGKGSFSNVYRVKDEQNNEYYAAKVAKIMIDEDTIDLLEAKSLFREVNIMSSFNHPSILKFIGYSPINFEKDPFPTLITEFASNGSLKSLIDLESSSLSPRGWDDTKKLINIFGIAAGMSYLHKHKVIHRDLKPENILVDDYLHPKIGDFGLSKLTDDLLILSMNYQSQSEIKGTPIYMAPEILMNEDYSEAGDVYSFAFIVFEIMTSEIPYKNDNFYTLMKKLINGDRPQISYDVPDSYRQLIEICWSQDANHRPSFDDIVTELKTNKSFITETIDETEFYFYVDYIDSYQSSFDVSKRVIHFSEFIKDKGQNKTIKTPINKKTKSSEYDTNPASKSKNISIENKMTKLKDKNTIISVPLKKDQEEIVLNKEQPKAQEKTMLNKEQQKVQEETVLYKEIQKIQEEVALNELQKVQEEVALNELQKVQEKNENEQQINSEKLNYPLPEFNISTKSNQAPVEKSKLIDRTCLEVEAPLGTENEDESYALDWEAEEKERQSRSKKLYLSKEKSEFFKYIIRMGISNVHRHEIYLILTCKNKDVDDLRRFWPEVLSQSSTPKYENIIGLFGYPNYELFTQQSHLEDLLTIIKNQNHEIEFSPMIPCVASILQLFYDDFLSYIIIQSMINEENEKYFVVNKKNFISMLSTIETIIKLNRKKLYKHSKSIKLDFSVVSLFIMPILFSKKLNKNIVLTIFDSFLNEGQSVLIRYVIGFIMKLESDLLQTNHPSEFMMIIYDYIISLRSPSEMQQIVSLAFGTDYLKRKKIFSIEKAERINEHVLSKHLTNQQLPNFDDFYRFYANISNRTNTVWRLNHTRMFYANVNGGKLITNDQFWEIKKHLYSYFTHLNAYPIFNLSEDGSTFYMFLKRAKSVSPCMLVIKASSRTIGAFLANPIQPVYKRETCGSPLTTIFELKNMKTYHYSKKNEFFLFVTRNSVAIGNGATGSAIFFEDGFETIVSDPCETFDSPSLLESQREKIENVELYKLAP